MERNYSSQLKNFQEEIKKKEEESHKIDGIPILAENRSDNEFNGIISHLGSGNPENALGKEFVITSSSNNGSSELPENAIKYKTDSHFASSNKEDSWWCIEFKNHQIIPKNYRLKSNASSCESYPHPKSWYVEGSNNNSNWEIIDEQHDCSLLKGECLIHTFPIQNPNNKKYKFIRIRHIGKCFNNEYFLCFNCIEFFGYLV